MLKKITARELEQNRTTTVKVEALLIWLCLYNWFFDSVILFAFEFYPF